MAKPANKPTPNPNAKLPEHVERVKKDWDKKQKDNGTGRVSANVPGTKRTVTFNQVIFEENRVCVWTSDDLEADPDYIIVEPPTSYRDRQGNVVEDPMTTLAIAIDGATR